MDGSAPHILDYGTDDTSGLTVGPAFEPWPEIEQLGRCWITITQKIHGTNAQVLIQQNEETGHYDVFCGSRNRWLSLENDNYEFAKFVSEHQTEFIEKLGCGRWYGEWAGPGIGSAEGLGEKTLFLFDVFKVPPGRPLPPRVRPVPLLYSGAFDQAIIERTFDELKAGGSRAVEGFMRPEGIVVHIVGPNVRYKKVFKKEETKWDKGQNGPKVVVDRSAVAHLLQPIRLEKLLMRDESYRREYPKSLPQICRDYMADLLKEEQITGTEAEIKGTKKALGTPLFSFVKEVMGE
jgi:hypothetical protein